MKLKKLLATLAAALLVGAVAVGCGGGGGGGSEGGGGGTLTLGNIGWDENIAVSYMTKVVMEEDLGYDSVELQTLDVAPLYQGVATGDLDAFQDVWMPNHEQYREELGDQLEFLDPWYEGTTKYGIAVPDYMEDIQSLEDLPEAGTNEITGIEPGAAFHPQIREEVFPAYGLDDFELVESSTAGMLSELERAYNNEEPIIFLAWSPHWMNLEYDFHYLEDPKDAQGAFNDPAEVSSVVRADLQEDDPVAYEFLSSISLDEDQVNGIRLMQRDAGDDLEGARQWVEENRDVVEPWIEAANQAGEQAG